MREQIQQLIADGRTEEALDLLEKTSQDAVLLKARYNNGKKQYNMGMIDFSEWNRIQNQVNYAALELAGSGGSAIVVVPSNPSDPKEPAPVPDTKSKSSRKVFISYSHADRQTADAVVDHLKKNNIQPAIDKELLKAGENIEAFAARCIQENAFVLFLVSENSLLSGWVGLEILISEVGKKLIGTQILPAALDNTWYDSSKITDLYRKLDAQIKSLEKERKERIKINAPVVDIDEKLKRLKNHFNNLASFCNDLASVLTVDLSASSFDDGMEQLLEVIRG